MNPVLEDLVAQTGELATLPDTVIQLLEILQDDTTGADQVQTILERDPAMTGNVLKLANSAFYGTRREIATVRDALVILGNRSVAALTFATSMAPILRRELIGYGLTREQFWNHSLLAGAASSLAVQELDADELRCEAFTAGLVHDIGMLVINPYLLAQQIVFVTGSPTFGIHHQEKDTLGFDHSQAGADLADNWGFPDLLTEAIARHHETISGETGPEIVQAVAAGNLIAEFMDSDLQSHTEEKVRANLDTLGLRPRLLDRVRGELTAGLPQTLARATRRRPANRVTINP